MGKLIAQRGINVALFGVNDDDGPVGFVVLVVNPAGKDGFTGATLTDDSPTFIWSEAKSPRQEWLAAPSGRGVHLR